MIPATAPWRLVPCARRTRQSANDGGNARCRVRSTTRANSAGSMSKSGVWTNTTAGLKRLTTAGQPRVTLQEPPADHHPEPDAGAHVQHREVVQSLRQPVVPFRQAQRVRFLEQNASKAEPGREIGSRRVPVGHGDVGREYPAAL